DPAAIAAACQRLELPQPVQGTAQLYSGEATGLLVQLPGWEYPAVIDPGSGVVRYDNYEGAWGEQAHLDRFLQAYAVEKAKLEAPPPNPGEKGAVRPCPKRRPTATITARPVARRPPAPARRPATKARPPTSASLPCSPRRRPSRGCCATATSGPAACWPPSSGTPGRRSCCARPWGPCASCRAWAADRYCSLSPGEPGQGILSPRPRTEESSHEPLCPIDVR